MKVLDMLLGKRKDKSLTPLRTVIPNNYGYSHITSSAYSSVNSNIYSSYSTMSIPLETEHEKQVRMRKQKIQKLTSNIEDTKHKLPPVMNFDFTSLYPTHMRDFGRPETEHERQVRLRKEKIQKIVSNIKNGVDIKYIY